MRVYLASRFSTLLEMRERAKELTAINIECTSRWLRESSDPNISMKDASLTDSFLLSTAMVDVEDIKVSDAFVLFTVDPETPTVRGGRHWESGYAYGIGKPVYICGPKENIFHFFPNVTVCSDFEQVKQCLLKQKFQSETLRGYNQVYLGQNSTLVSQPFYGDVYNTSPVPSKR